MDEHAARRLRGFAEEAGRGLRGLDATLWRERMERRYRELDTAFEWLLDHRPGQRRAGNGLHAG